MKRNERITNMRKVDVIKEIVEKTSIDRTKVSIIIEAFMNTIESSVIDGQKVIFRGFGTFQLKRQNKKVARDMYRNINIVLQPYDVPTFKPSVEFLNLLKNNHS